MKPIHGAARHVTRSKGSGDVLPETGASAFSSSAAASSAAAAPALLRSRRLRGRRRFLRLAGVAAPGAVTGAVVVTAALPPSTATTSAAFPPPPRRRRLRRRSRRLAGGWSIRIWLPEQAQKRKGLRAGGEGRRARLLSGRNCKGEPERHDALKSLSCSTSRA